MDRVIEGAASPTSENALILLSARCPSNVHNNVNPS